MKEIKIEFTDKEITPWGGIGLLRQILDRINITEVLSNASLPEQGSKTGQMRKTI